MARGHMRVLGVLIALVVVGAGTLGGADEGGGAFIASSAPALQASQAVAAPEPAVTTTLPPPTSTTRAVSQVAVTTTSAPTPAPAASTTVAPPPPTTATTATTSTTVPPPPCRNSTDPACGPFRFDPQPGPDNPLSVHIVVGPAAPLAGQEMTFTVTLHDPDGVSHAGSTYNWGDSGIGESSVDPCEKYGPWDPPARDPAHATELLTLRHTYMQPGTYKVVFFFTGYPFDCVDSVTGRGDRPYASSASGTVTIDVG